MTRKMCVVAALLALIVAMGNRPRAQDARAIDKPRQPRAEATSWHELSGASAPFGVRHPVGSNAQERTPRVRLNLNS